MSIRILVFRFNLAPLIEINGAKLILPLSHSVRIDPPSNINGAKLNRKTNTINRFQNIDTHFELRVCTPRPARSRARAAAEQIESA
jgi:hypothetical protein